ncbi:MAG: NUDIX domain-containing protein [Candidatus Levybacteria bacterium]|nr:NUDIX domain-containing protein [Candidatus Levybacteria bacterium]
MKKGIDYIGIGAGAALVNSHGQIFLARRGEKAKNEKGKWQIPGGTVEFGETLEETVIREVREEFGVEIEILDRLEIHNHIIHEEKQHWVAVSFICKLTKGEPMILEPDKVSEIGWFSLEDAGKLPLSILGKGDIKELKKRYPNGITNFYK